jgi:3-dehydroquinate synthase
MEDLPLNKIDIFSDKETYELIIDTNFQEILELLKDTKAVIIDKNVFDLYNKDLKIEKD